MVTYSTKNQDFHVNQSRRDANIDWLVNSYDSDIKQK